MLLVLFYTTQKKRNFVLAPNKTARRTRLRNHVGCNHLWRNQLTLMNFILVHSIDQGIYFVSKNEVIPQILTIVTVLSWWYQSTSPQFLFYPIPPFYFDAFSSLPRTVVPRRVPQITTQQKIGHCQG